VVLDTATGQVAGTDISEVSSFADPVFVLCNGRSGSTLLRFLLDAHPDLACPPETNLPGLCVQLATVWSLIEGAPLSSNRGDEPPHIPEAAIAGVRETMDRMVGSYLARRGKKRYCDKSLGTARFAELLLRVYPEARFICVYRHPMDVIASGMEACPWGLNGYGFDGYIAATPGNSVLALANFWADNVRATLAAEEQFPDHCYRLRYEDLVSDPETTAAGLFEFLGVAPAPGISQTCFSAERERFGPADYKIWSTSRITSDSVGRGWSIPTGMIPPHLIAAMNEMAAKLGYLAIDGDWGTSEPPADLRVPISAPTAAPEPGAAGEAGTAEPGATQATTAGGTTTGGDGAAQDAAGAAEPVAAEPVPVAGIPGEEQARSRWLGERLRAGFAGGAAAGFAAADHIAQDTFVLVAINSAPGEAAEYWHVDVASATVTFAGRAAQEHSDWDLVSTAEVWEQVLGGKLNFYVALRACQLRYCDNGEPAPLVADNRIAFAAHLLGVKAW